MNTKTRALSLALSLATMSALPGSAPQDPAKPAPAPAAATEKLSEWPKLADADKERVPALLGQFRKQDAAVQDAAKKKLVAMGVGVMPQLFAQVTDRTDNINPPVFAVFDAMLTPAHAALMAREVKKPSIELRRYLTIRMCHFRDSEVLPVLQATMADKDEVTAFHAALGALALKHKEALGPVIEYTKSRWSGVAKVVGEVLPHDRDLANHVFETIAKAPSVDQMTGLRLLRSLAVKDQKSTVRPFLQAADNSVKREAINVMRVLHDEAPVENMPVFQVIEQANAWLKKV